MANIYDVPVVCIYREGSEISGSLSEVTDILRKYQDTEELIKLVEELIER